MCLTANEISAGFTKMMVSLWSVTMLSLYIRVQVDILGRHLYIDTARGLGSSQLPVRFYFSSIPSHGITSMILFNIMSVVLVSHLHADE